MKTKQLYRQGDVLIARVSKIPAGLTPVPKDNGRVILAYGEVTGHAHAVLGAVEFLAADLADLEERFLRVEAESRSTVKVYEDRLTGRTITPEPYYDEDQQAIVTRDPYQETELVAIGEREVLGATVVHEEHGTITLPPGAYRVVRQREYQPEAPVYVAD